ncbi:hypothetical protein [Micromonospora cathayae]|uniref:RNA polymerase, sigma 54 subunit, RpoN/SigL n=1 Tax=Micromonospora cathayae TaxID=3028804 RepID=A0ABY7ZKT9_9ACTN|nr:hypothetical protein [Micromonospora sp. HUAS 3]WDZ82902.1 hypothetical protein PVK37_20780 [Micromonospora sp. HUAS 3]
MSQPPGLDLRPLLRTEISLNTVVSVRILSLSATDLALELHTAADSNPALVVREAPHCHRCGRRTFAGACRGCGDPAREPGYPAEPQSVVSSWDLLRQDLLVALPSSLAGAALEVLTLLDERGFIDPVELERFPHQVRDPVMAALRDVGPPGIGAADVRESLLLQVEAAPLSAPERQLARRLLSEFAEVLETGGPGAVARAIGRPETEITALLGRLSRLLRPYPRLDGGDTGRPDLARQPPDVLFERDGERIRAVVPESERWEVGVDGNYRAALARAADRSGEDVQVSAARQQMREASLLVNAVHRRWALLVRVAGTLAERQRGPLLAGSLTFRPLTQRAVAGQLGVHESTVSRAVRNRTARLVDGRTVPLRVLFGVDDRARLAVAELLHRHPRFSDRQVAEMLTADGLPIARRTVAKYRRALSR